MEQPLVSKRKKPKIKDKMGKRPSIGADLHHLDVEKAMVFDTGEYAKRRALKLTKKNNSWGFTLQTYGIKHKKTNEIEVMTYIDYVDIDGAAWLAGLRKGDVILAVNGENVGNHTHKQLVEKIKQTTEILRLIVHFEDCCKKVELHERFLKLKAVLTSKIQELREVEMQEIRLMEKCYADRGLSRFDLMRQSIVSNVSSSSDSWDAYSIISSPYTHKSTGHFQAGQWSSVSSIRSFNIDEGSSITEDDNIEYIDSDTDSLSFTASTPYNHKSDTDLASKARNQSRNEFPVPNSKLSRSYDVGLNMQNSTRHKEIVEEDFEDNVFVDHKDQGVHLVTFEEAEQSYLYTTESPLQGSALRRNESTNSDKIFYKGENGKMIVPKICVEGESEYTTFDHIDTQSDPGNISNEDIVQSVNENLPKLDKNSEILQEKIVAMEIAKEMARIEKMVEKDEGNLVKMKTVSTKMKRIQKSKSQPIYKTSPAIMKNWRDVGQKRTEYRSHDLSPRMQRSKMAPHVGGSLSYDKLKSSVPDIVISFHADDYQIVYINEGNHTTKL